MPGRRTSLAINNNAGKSTLNPTLFPRHLHQQLGKTQLVPIGIGQMEVALSPGAILRRGRRATGRERSLIERIDIVNAEDRAAPPGREIARRESQIDEGMP